MRVRKKYVLWECFPITACCRISCIFLLKQLVLATVRQDSSLDGPLSQTSLAICIKGRDMEQNQGLCLMRMKQKGWLAGWWIFLPQTYFLGSVSAENNDIKTLCPFLWWFKYSETTTWYQHKAVWRINWLCIFPTSTPGWNLFRLMCDKGTNLLPEWNGCWCKRHHSCYQIKLWSADTSSEAHTTCQAPWSS